jgi:hypothetical protein
MQGKPRIGPNNWAPWLVKLHPKQPQQMPLQQGVQPPPLAAACCIMHMCSMVSIPTPLNQSAYHVMLQQGDCDKFTALALPVSQGTLNSALP